MVQIHSFGWKFGVQLTVMYMLIKGLMMSVLGLIKLSYCKKSLGIDGTACQTMGTIAQTPWAVCACGVLCVPTATHCNTLQRTATHCNALQRTATHCNTLQHTATHCNTLQHTATHCNTLQHTATHCNTLQHTATRWRVCAGVVSCVGALV